MHSSQNEQDSRFYADFAMLPCFEPRSQQQCYDMAREAFELSEQLHTPVLIRLVTRLSHARSTIERKPPDVPTTLKRTTNITEWLLLPVFSRRNYTALIEKNNTLQEQPPEHSANKLEIEGHDTSFAVITAGLGGNYYEENLAELTEKNVRERNTPPPARLHIGAYPAPASLIQKLCASAKKLLVIEEGQPFIETKLRGLLPPAIEIDGKLNGKLPRTGELDPDNIRSALGLPPKNAAWNASIKLPARPPQLCKGCPHANSYETLNEALAAYDTDKKAVLADIGCYSLGAFPPYSAIETIVCMGASISMARGAAEAGVEAAVAVIGDSTFLHSGMGAVIDAVSENTAMTLVILDNSSIAMTGCQKPALPSSRLKPLLLGLGAERVVELETARKNIKTNAARLAGEIAYRGFSVVIFRGGCIRQRRVKQEGDRRRT
jgi:indolepyruvate ferredoxin oxidoreductase alpha subunit